MQAAALSPADWASPRLLLTERFIAAAALTAFLFPSSAFFTVSTYLALGQAHFIMTYLSQWRAGLYSRRGLALYLLTAALGLAGMYFDQNVFIFIVSVFFVGHALMDDLHLMGLETGRVAVLAAAPHYLLTLALSADVFLGTVFALPAFYVSMGLYAVFLAAAFLGRLWRGNSYIVYVTAITPLVFLLVGEALLRAEGMATYLAAARVFGFIILIHYFNWYTYIYRKIKARDPSRVKPYLREIAWVNILCAGGSILCFWLAREKWLLLKDNLLYLVVYWPPMVYFWTLMHMAVARR